MFLQKQQQRAAKFSLSPWISEPLAPISASANNKTSCTKVHISPGEKLSFQSCEVSVVLTHPGVPQHKFKNPVYFYQK